MTEKERQLYEERVKKLEALRQNGTDPYPAETSRTHSLAEALEQFAELSKAKQLVTLAGRVRALRTHGALTFGNLEDGAGKIQFLLKKDGTEGRIFEEFQRFVDIGDFVELGGLLMTTERGEKTLQVAAYRMLAKSLRALPDKWHGLTDTETRLRKRYLDLLGNPEVRELFVKKAKFWETIRSFLRGRGFLEVELPVFERIPGGADAEPFQTHHKALDQDFYLRISLELPLKRLLVGGFERVFEIGRVFRNEGISTEHLQDYMQMEFYWAYHDYRDLMTLVEAMYKEIVRQVTGGLTTTYEGKKIDWGKKWPRLEYVRLFEKLNGLDPLSASREELAKKAKALGLRFDSDLGKGRLIDLIYKKTVRPTLIEPAFLINPPVELVPLTKRAKEDPRIGERMQPVAGGTELGTGFTELNDPLDQRVRFEEQMKLRLAGDKEAQQLDEDFVEALEYGMPPAAGFGLSERLFAVLMDKSIRETVIFPPMREGKKD